MSDSNFWQTYALTDLAHYHNGYAFKPDDWRAEGTKIIRIEQLNKPNGRYDYFSGDYPSVNHIEDGDLIFSWSATLKVVIWKHGCGVLNQHLFRVDEKEGFDKHFLYYLLDFHMDALSGGSHGSTMKHIKRGELQTYKVKVPPLPVQKRIAQILNSVDNQIDATQALIDKYTAIKQGMMADLFSRGIDPETKALRPTFEEAPELYHKTPLGMLPKGWDVKTLGNAINGSGFIQTGPFGSQLHAYDYVDSGVPVVMPQDIVQGRISIEKIAYITETKASELSRHKLKLNDVIFSRRGDLTRSSFVDVQNGYEGFLCGTGCLLMRVDASNIVGGWFSYLYSSDLVQRQVEGLAVGTTMANLNGSILKKLIIPFPSVEEQTDIFSKIVSVQSVIDENAKHLGKLVAQKAGLMQDLLTGKVSVPA